MRKKRAASTQFTYHLFVRVRGETIQPSYSVRNLGVILGPSADMDDIIKKIGKTCRFQLTNISKIITMFGS